MMAGTVREALRLVSDRDLLAQIRRGSVHAVGAVALGATYWQRHSAMIDEAKRRGIL